MTDGDRCMALRLALHVLLLGALAGAQWPSVHLNRTLRVQRGLKVDIKPFLSISELDHPQLTHCSFRQVPRTAHLSCGDLGPSWLQCDSPGPLFYRHYGCSATNELLYLQLLSGKNSTAVGGETERHVAFFAVEVIVGDPRIRLVHLETSLVRSRGYEYSDIIPVFPPNWLGNCYYRVMNSLLPTADIQGLVGIPFPCGYVPREPFRLMENANMNRSILLEITSTSPSLPETLHVLLFSQPPQEENDYVYTLPPVLPLQVFQFSNTPIPANLLPCPHSYRQCVYVFPVLQAGAFIPAYSPAKPQSRYTRFTSEDIDAGIVAFIPNCADPITNAFYFTILDYAGHVLAQSAVEVSVLRRDWNLPSQRFVAPLQVPLGGRVFLNDRYLQFYIPPESFCLENTFVSLSQSPSQGNWVFADGRNVRLDDNFPHTYLANETLVYQHSGNGSTTTDSTAWKVTCDGKSFQVHMSVLIIPGKNDWPPETKVHPATLIAFCGMASPFLLDTAVYADPGLTIHVNASEGAFIRLAGTNMLLGHPLPPYVAPGTLGSTELVTEFSIEEVQQNLIWYIPAGCFPHWLDLHVHVPGQAHATALLIQVRCATVSLQNFFLLSASAGFLKLLQNQPLPVTSSSPVFITSSFLYARSDTDSPGTVTYRVLTPPKHGYICSSSTPRCSESLNQFTQAAVDDFKIVYRTAYSNILVNDSFEFQLGYSNIVLVPPFNGTFQIYAAQLEPLVPSEDQLWMEIGNKQNIPLRYFRPLYSQLQKTAIFRILSLPKFGELCVKNQSVTVGSQYTFEDLKRNRLQYQHNRESLKCSDSLAFIASNSTHNISKSITIAIRQRHGEKKYLGLQSFKKTVLDQTNFVFTSKDFQVLSDFCPSFVLFTVDSEPSYGVLRLFLPSLHTFTLLGNRSMFTEEDIRAGRLWYSSIDHLNFSSRADALDSIAFNLTDPTKFGESDINGNNRQLSFDFEVTFVQPTDTINIYAVFNIRETHVLSWLPKYQRFGYIFQPDDIRVDSTPDLHVKHINVKILIKESPKKGWIMRDELPVTEFYLHHLAEGRVRYMPTEWWVSVATSDIFTISILLETNNASIFINTVYNQSMTLVWSWVHPTQNSYLVRESASELILTFRRSVDNGTCPGYESNFTLGFSSSNATVTSSCNDQWKGDVCIDFVNLSFPPGNCSLSVTMEIAQDNDYEGPEDLLLYVANCSNCVTNITSDHPLIITINDDKDYAYVDIVAHSAFLDTHSCSREISATEEMGEVVLSLVRTNNMEHEVNVSCYTRPDSATRGEDFEHLRRNTTVTFAPHQHSAECIVNINDDTMYEKKERFYVYLEPAGGLVDTALEKPLCIYIVYDPHDAPVLSFQPQPLIVQEREGRKMLANFTIFRSGENLGLNTSVCYQVMNETFTTATAGIDFYLLGNTQSLGCAYFTPYQTAATCSLVVSSDNELEGPEFVFLELLNSNLIYGELGRPTELNITIVDGTEPAYIGLSSTEFHIDEMVEGLQHFPIIRNGSINQTNRVLCKLKPINTTAQIVNFLEADFVVPSKPETITFQPFDTIQNCNMWLKNDDVYEGVEGLYLELDYTPLDPGVVIRPDRQRAVIYIHDSDDEPRVWFSSMSYTVQEPVSNFEVDRKCAMLTLLRGGDPSLTISISYTTVGNSAQPDEHYVPVNGTIRFDPDQNTSTLTVPILANEDSSEVGFSVRLLPDEAAQSTDLLPRAAEPSEASVVILNTPVTGVLFPDNPVLVSLLTNGSYATGSTLFYNAPVVCVDPCDTDFESIADVSHTEYCRDHQIDPSLTEYSWYTSSDGLNYRQIRRATIFTSFDGKALEPVYLERGMYVRCTAQAVTTSGTQGNSRSSISVRLSHSMLSPETCDSVSSFIELYKNDGFTGYAEELLQLTIILRHYENYVPLVSSRPFTPSNNNHFLSLLTRPFTRDQHSCSNLVESGPQKASFLSPYPTVTSLSSSSSLLSSVQEPKSQLLYQHFNSTECQWKFNVWLPLSVLTDPTLCDAQLSEDGQMPQLSLSLYYAYIHIGQDGGVSILPPTSHSNRVRATWLSGHELSIPFDTYPRTASDIVSTSTYIYPIMTRFTRGSATVIFYSVSESGEPIQRVEVTGEKGVTLSGQLLYSSTPSSSPRAEVRQAWMLEEIPSEDGTSLSLQLWPECSSACRPLNFSWFISTAEPGIVPETRGVITMSAGGQIEGGVWLAPYFNLRPNHTLRVELATLYRCTDPVNNTTCTYSQIWTMQHYDEKVVIAAGFDMKTVYHTPSSFNFTFNADPLGTAGPFQLEIKCSIQHQSNSSDLAEYPVHLLTLPFYFSDPDSSSSGGISRNIALLASAITIFLTAAALVALVLMIVGLHWRLQVRRKRTEANKEEEEVVSRNSEHRERNVHSLRKSSSTTSFPTVEKLKTHLLQSAPDRLQTTSQKTGQISRGAFLSKSLPNLMLASSTEGQGRKRQLRKPAANVKVKSIYTLQASLDMWRGKKEEEVGRGKEKDLQVRVIKKSLHGSPIQVHVQPLTGELASYATRDITGSTVTPETGSAPATEL